MPLSAILGHRGALALLARAVARDSLPPSLVFAGPTGVGKFTTAAALAQVLNCERPVRPGELASDGSGAPRDVVAPAASRAPAGANGTRDRAAADDAGSCRDGASPALDACGECRSCRRIARVMAGRASGQETALDCFRVASPDEKQSIKVGVIRELVAAAAYRPFDGRRRLIVVDEADALEVGAQNALLKVLEEPPPATVFVLVTSRPDALLATIRSRCPRLRFGELSGDDVQRALTARGMAAVEARAVAARADGSLGRALQLASGVAVEDRDVATAVLKQLASVGNSVSGRLAAAQALLARAPGGKGASKKAAAVSRAQVAGRLDAMAALLRDLQVVATRADTRWLAHADLAADLASLARAFDGPRASRAFAAVDRAQFALERNVGHKSVADWLAFEL